MSASLPAFMQAKHGPDQAGTLRVTDVALHAAFVDSSPGTTGSVPRHLTEPIEIAGDLWIGPLGDLANRVISACYCRGENHSVPIAMFTSPYALYRVDAPSAGDALLNWDPDRRLTTCLALSRIVQPTSIAFANAARIIFWPNRPVEIIAAYVYQKAAWNFTGRTRLAH
jgi:hypothetical protein